MVTCTIPLTPLFHMASSAANMQCFTRSLSKLNGVLLTSTVTFSTPPDIKTFGGVTSTSDAQYVSASESVRNNAASFCWLVAGGWVGGMGVSVGTDVRSELENVCMAGLLAVTATHRINATNNTVATIRVFLRLRLRYC